jgi:hypothetical protein
VPRTARSWTEQQEVLAYARVLAEFANLVPEAIDSFRAKYPDFFPQGWWEYEPASDGRDNPPKQWQVTQKFLREAWQSQFEIELYDYLKILLSIFNPDHITQAVNPRWTGPPERPLFADIWDILWERDQPKPAYYLAIKFLSGNGWRAKTCEFCDCGRRFVAEYSKAKYCTYGDTPAIDGTIGTCFQAFRKKDKKNNWQQHKDEVNARRRKEYALQTRKNRSRKSQPRQMKRR